MHGELGFREYSLSGSPYRIWKHRKRQSDARTSLSIRSTIVASSGMEDTT